MLIIYKCSKLDSPQSEIGNTNWHAFLLSLLNTTPANSGTIKLEPDDRTIRVV